ncbi:sigma-70 family RNA polymerase sigma factor [Prauserella muralis]|uniref:RNA polymerase sigma factor n=1 Tax=Prauserella muralis TaxID=588067 RepID=A0A2V4AMI4_9PSEU|nr:sigma-70 family RNA polymerase sigma factor [Prauserella muralis]PXY21194.1 RNA polymerase subunit sigma [Prauserella muralis]TWE30296.1 RNA polymerase sigma-70 factor (ECF subfamily) [Prauserella muralis]
MDDEITEHALRAADGDRAAAERFVAATRAQLHRLLTYLSDPRVAEDLVQETYLRAFGALRGYEGRSPARTWLFAIARHVAADHLRTRGRRPVTTGVPVAEETGGSSPDHGRVVVLHSLIAALESERREAFVLTQVLGLSYAEAAQVCDCAVGTIRSRVFRARDELARALGEGDSQQASSSR